MIALPLALLLAPLQMGSPFPQMVMPDDPRIQIVSYAANRVVDLRVADGFAAVVELAPDERVETIVLGNTAGWDVAPNHSGNRIVVRPLGSAMATNMIVVTDQRRYVFAIAADGGGAGVFALRFVYPTGQAGNVRQSIRAADYRLRGNKTLYPIVMTDDGRRTTITWDRQVSLPAIFAIDERGREALVNGRMVDEDYVVEGIAKRYIFRLGKTEARATRVVLKTAP